MTARQGKPDEELFLSRPSSNGDDSPTVEPLRISKPSSPNPPPAGRYNYPPPSSSKKTFPLPPGASSSASPLPYPEDEDTYEYVRPESRTHHAPYPEDKRTSSDDRMGSGGASSQSRPGPKDRTATNDTAPRLTTSPIDKRGPGLAERRGTAPKPLPESPGPDLPDKEGLFAQAPRREPKPAASTTSYPEFQQQQKYYPPPIPTSSSNGKPGGSSLAAPVPSSMNRFASTASTSTTRATRGSPPPPETPVEMPDHGGIEARYAAAGIAGTATLSSLQAQNAAAAQRTHQYGTPPISQGPQSPGLGASLQHAPRPWTPTESPDNQPHGPPTVYQGISQVNAAGSPPQRPQQQRQGSGSQVALEQDFQRMQMSHSPPPAYSSVTTATGATQSYPAEKRATASIPAAIVTSPRPDIAAPLKSPEIQHPDHPAFANDPRQEPVNPQQAAQNAQNSQAAQSQQFANSSPFQGAGPSSPPPLPEGWIAHLDQNSGQYYYIHLPTQATQWEFPKGVTPLTMNNDMVPLSPSVSTYGNPLASPGMSAFGKTPLGSPSFPPHTPGYAESIMSMASQTPTAAGFSGPPPSAGVDMYKVAPTNGVYFGPYLRYVNMDFERGLWLGTIMLVTDAPQPPTIHIHQSVDLSPNPRQLVPNPIFTHQRWTFYRYDVDLQMGEGPSDKWTYAITSHLGCTRYEFLVAGRYETNWRFIAHSGNDFAMNTSMNDRSKLGGAGFMWKDILQKNVECGGFHVQLGLGDQIYGDRLWKEVPLLKQWLAMSGKENRKSAAWTARHEEDVSHAYFHYYTSHFDQAYLREAFAQIPHILQIDDHDM
jgi:hypothetical protein